MIYKDYNDKKEITNHEMTYDIISKRKKKTIKILNPIDIYNEIKKYAKSDQELFLVLTLNPSHDIIGIHIATKGLANKTVIHPREIFKHVFLDNATSLIIAHNHPSNVIIQPSIEDKEITRQINEICELMQIEFLDHLIINKKSYYSFRVDGKIVNTSLLNY